MGLTMAEIVIIVLFILLLAFSSLFQKLFQSRDALSRNVETVQTENKQISKENRRLKSELAELKNSIENEDFNELVKKLDQERSTNRKLETKLAEKNREIAEKGIERLKKTQAELRERNQKLKDEIAKLKKDKGIGGPGRILPACWSKPVNGRKKSEYIFDIAVSDGGLKLRDNKLPHRRADQAKLPLNTVFFDQSLSPTVFLKQLRPLFEWSVKEECRFYVRIFDQVSRGKRPLYKSRVIQVEQRFYKYEVLDRPF